MDANTKNSKANNHSQQFIALLKIFLGLLAFCALFLLIDQTYYRFISSHFPNVGSSFWLATTWGIVSRAPWILVLLIVAFFRPRLLGLQLGEMKSHWFFVSAVIILNCLVVGAFLFLSRSSTPYSGNQWLLTEIITVPFVEELFWRGLVFSILFDIMNNRVGGNHALILTVWFSGIAFGILHAANALTGVPFQFVLIQTINAVIWGVIYGYARAKTNSVFPSILAHAAMNLVVILF